MRAQGVPGPAVGVISADSPHCIRRTPKSSNKQHPVDEHMTKAVIVPRINNSLLLFVTTSWLEDACMYEQGLRCRQDMNHVLLLIFPPKHCMPNRRQHPWSVYMHGCVIDEC